LKINLVTILFGKEFVTKYINYCLPSLLAKENLPAVIGKHSVNYTIYCPLSDFNIIKESQIFKKIRSLGNNGINFKHHNIPNNYIENDPSGHHFAWQDSMSEAAKKNECVIFIIPDNVFSNNCLSKWMQLIEDGYTQILAPSPYTLEESATTIINGYKSSIKESIDIYQQDILNIYKNNIHPLSSCMEVGQTVVNTHPEHRINIKDKKIIIRTITSNPLVINFSKKEKKIAVDQIRSISLEPLRKYSKFGIFLPKTIREKFNYGPWLNSFLNEDSAVEFQYKHNIEFNENGISYDLSKSSDKFYKWALSINELHKLTKELESNGCLISACIVIEMMRYKPMQIQKLYDKSLCIVCPKDKLINVKTKNKILSLLQNYHHNELIELMENFFIKKNKENIEESIFFGSGKLKRLKINYKSIYILEEVNSSKWTKVGIYFTDEIKINNTEKNNKIINKDKKIKSESRNKIKRLLVHVFKKIISTTVVWIIIFGKFIPNTRTFSKQLNILYRVNRYKNQYGEDKLNEKINEYLTSKYKFYLYKIYSKYLKLKDMINNIRNSHRLAKLNISNEIKFKTRQLIMSTINIFSVPIIKTKNEKQSEEVYNQNMMFISLEILKFSRIKRGCNEAKSYNFIDDVVIKNIFEKYNNLLFENKKISEENKLALAITLLNNEISRSHGLQFINNLMTKKSNNEFNGINKDLLLRAVIAAARVYIILNKSEFAEKCYIFALALGRGNAITSKDRVILRGKNIIFPDSFETLYNTHSYLPKQIF